MTTMKYVIFLFLTSGLSLALSGCVLLTDAATRLAYDIKAAALELESSALTELEIEHKPMSWPSGVAGDYRVLIQTTNPSERLNGTLAVGKSGTSYHKRFVSVPKTLYVKKAEGETVFLLLIKTEKMWSYTGDGETLKGDKTIELVRVR